MKIRILAIVAAVLFIIAVNTAAADAVFDISVEDNYLYAHRGDSVTEIAELVGASETELLTEFNKGGLLYFAVASDNSVRVRLSEYADNFSVEAVDISYLDDDNKQSFLKSLDEKTGNNAILTKNGDREYAKMCETINGEQGAYTVTQYITVCGGKTYYLSCYNEGEGTSDTVEKIFQSLKLYGQKTAPRTPDWSFVALAIGIAAFALIAVMMVIGLYRTIKFKEN